MSDMSNGWPARKGDALQQTACGVENVDGVLADLAVFVAAGDIGARP